MSACPRPAIFVRRFSGSCGGAKRIFRNEKPPLGERLLGPNQHLTLHSSLSSCTCCEHGGEGVCLVSCVVIGRCALCALGVLASARPCPAGNVSTNVRVCRSAVWSVLQKAKLLAVDSASGYTKSQANTLIIHWVAVSCGRENAQRGRAAAKSHRRHMQMTLQQYRSLLCLMRVVRTHATCRRV